MSHQFFPLPGAIPELQPTGSSSSPSCSSPSTVSEEAEEIIARARELLYRNNAPAPNPAAGTGAATTSLEILNPAPWVPVSDPEAEEEKAVNPDRELLESLSTQLIQIFCTQDWDNPLLELATPNFTAYIDHVDAKVRTFDEHIAFHQWLHLNHPDYVYEVDNVSADVDDARGLACVWTQLRVTGYPTHIRRESMTVFWWRRRKGKWRCYKQFGIRGVNWFQG